MAVTPEQINKWREEFFKSKKLDVTASDRNLRIFCMTQEFDGYCLAKQETEQAIKDAEKLRTVVINLIAACEEREVDDGERCYLVPAQEFDDLQELQND